MDWTALAMFIDPICKILGVGSIDSLNDAQQSQVLQMAENAYQDWQDKEAKEIGNVTTESAMTNLPNQSWLKANLYEKQSDLYKNFLNDYQNAVNEDNSSARANPILKGLADAANTIVNDFTFGQTNNVVADAYRNWANQNQNRVLSDYQQKEQQLQNQAKQLDNQIAQSWDKNQLAVKQAQAKGGNTNV